MNIWFQRQHTHSRMTVLGVVLALSVIGIGALHYAPAAHEHIHDDAHEADHHCVVEIFADGVVSDVVELHITYDAEIVATETAARSDVWVEETKHLRPLGRAPPLG